MTRYNTRRLKLTRPPGVKSLVPLVDRLRTRFSAFKARDVSLWRARGVGERSIAGIQMGQVGDLIRAQGAAAAGVLGPAEHPGLEEGAVNDQLRAALKQIEHAPVKRWPPNAGGCRGWPWTRSTNSKDPTAR